MKRKIAALLALVFCLSLVGCGEPKTPETVEEAVEQAQGALSSLEKQADEKEAAQQKEFDKSEIKVKNAELEIPEYGKVKIKSAGIVENIIGKNLVVVYDYTNLYESDINYYSRMAEMITLYQGGVKLDGSMTMLDKDGMTEIKPGATIEVIVSYKLRDTETDVEFEAKLGEEICGTYTLKLK